MEQCLPSTTFTILPLRRGEDPFFGIQMPSTMSEDGRPGIILVDPTTAFVVPW